MSTPLSRMTKIVWCDAPRTPPLPLDRTQAGWWRHRATWLLLAALLFATGFFAGALFSACLFTA